MMDSSRRFFGGSGDDSRDQLHIPRKKRSDRTSFPKLGEGASGSRSARDRGLLFATAELLAHLFLQHAWEAVSTRTESQRTRLLWYDKDVQIA
jgi:hypothetical protein